MSLVVSPTTSADGRSRRAVRIICGVWVALLLAWSVLLPTYRSADEVNHVSAAIALSETDSWPGFKRLFHVDQVVDTLEAAGYRAHPPRGVGNYYPLPADGAEPRETRQPFLHPGEAVTLLHVNGIGQHPPGYYGLLALVDRALPADTPYTTTVWMFRLVSVLLMAPLPWLLAATARRLGADPPAVVVMAVVPFLIPQLGALGGAVNNDNLLIVACAVVAWLSTRIATGDLSGRTAVGAGLALAAALLAKAFGLVFVPVLVAAYLLAAVRARTWRVPAVRLLTAGSLALLGAWWWLRNVLVFGQLQPAGHLARLDVPLDPGSAVDDYLLAAWNLIPMRFWATLSIKPGSPFPPAVTSVLSIALLAAMVLFVVRRRSFLARRADALLLLAPFVLCAVVLVSSTWELFLATGFPRGLQGRYLFAGISGVAAALGLGVMATVPVRSRETCGRRGCPVRSGLHRPVDRTGARVPLRRCDVGRSPVLAVPVEPAAAGAHLPDPRRRGDRRAAPPCRRRPLAAWCRRRPEGRARRPRRSGRDAHPVTGSR